MNMWNPRIVRVEFVMHFLGSEKGGLLEKGSFRKAHFLDILENPQTVENKEESNHVLKIFRKTRVTPLQGVWDGGCVAFPWFIG